MVKLWVLILFMLSVIIPFYNSRKFLPGCVGMCKAQTLSNIEFIFIDDGSTDNGSKLLQSLIEGDNRFVAIKKENGGTMSAWAEGLKHIKGDYIGFFDVDDRIDKDMYKEMYETAIKNDADIVKCNLIKVFKGKSYVKKSVLNPGLYSGDAIREVHSRVFINDDFERVSNARWEKIYRKELILSNSKYYDPPHRYNEDRHVVPGLVLACKSYYYLDKPFYSYIQWECADSTLSTELLYEDIKSLRNKHRQMLDENGFEGMFSENLIRENISYLQILIYRNLCRKCDAKIKDRTIKDILGDNEFRHTFKKYKQKFNIRDRMFLGILYGTGSTLLGKTAKWCLNLADAIYSKHFSKNNRVEVTADGQ
jgi:glycosyltransferase involved in cell wall biosynthesis